MAATSSTSQARRKAQVAAMLAKSSPTTMKFQAPASPSTGRSRKTMPVPTTSGLFSTPGVGWPRTSTKPPSRPTSGKVSMLHSRTGSSESGWAR